MQDAKLNVIITEMLLSERERISFERFLLSWKMAFLRWKVVVSDDSRFRRKSRITVERLMAAWTYATSVNSQSRHCVAWRSSGRPKSARETALNAKGNTGQN